MSRIVKILLLGSVASVAHAATQCSSLCKGGLPAVLASALSAYPPAQTYCSSKYPVPRQTTTSIVPTSTITTTVATITSTTTVATISDVRAAPPSTVTSTTRTTTTITVTSTDTETDTATATVTVTQSSNKKRTVDTRFVKFKILKKKASHFVASACSCLEKPATTTLTTTPIFKSSVTATSTTSVTATVTSTFTPITTTVETATNPVVSITTITTTTTTTTTTTVTSTVTVSPTNVCTPGAPGSLFPEQCGPVGNQCACYITSDGSGFCGEYYGTCGPACTSNSDCGPGLACFASSESNCGFVCALPSDASSCPTSGNPNKRSSRNPMAFKNIAREAKWRHPEVYVAPEDHVDSSSSPSR